MAYSDSTPSHTRYNQATLRAFAKPDAPYVHGRYIESNGTWVRVYGINNYNIYTYTHTGYRGLVGRACLEDSHSGHVAGPCSSGLGAL